MMLRKRHYGVWLVLALLIYSIGGTGWNLATKLSTYAPLHIVFGVAHIGLSAWLLIEVFSNSARQALSAKVLFWSYIGYYTLLAAVFIPDGKIEQIVPFLFLGAATCAIWGAVYWYLKRFSAP